MSCRPFDDLEPGFYARVPAQARLRLDAPHIPVADAPAVFITTRTTRDAYRPQRRENERELTVDLSAYEGRVVRIDFENAAAALPRRPRIVAPARSFSRAPLVEPPAPSPSRPNTLLYVVDTLRADRLSIYGHPRPTSPRLEELSRRAVVFENAYSTGYHTASGIPPLFTSRYFPEVNDRLKEGPDAVPFTLAELLANAGYATAAFQANLWLRPSLGFARGFDTYEVMEAPGDHELPKPATAAALSARALEWLGGDHGSRPFFLYVQSMDVHPPYEIPREYRGRFGASARVRQPGDPIVLPPEMERRPEPNQNLYRKLLLELQPALYEDAVAYADHEIGSLIDRMDALGLSDDTVIIVTADHGEALGEGHRYLHGLSLHEEQIRIPLLVALPWRREGVRIPAFASLVDILPTVLDLAGVEPPPQLRGRSLLRPVPPGEPDAAVIDVAEEVAVREGRWKLFVKPDGTHLYDLESDPAERSDRIDDEPVIAGYLADIACRRAPSLAAMAPSGSSSPKPLDPSEHRKVDEALRALGYIE